MGRFAPGTMHLEAPSELKDVIRPEVNELLKGCAKLGLGVTLAQVKRFAKRLEVEQLTFSQIGNASHSIGETLCDELDTMLFLQVLPENASHYLEL